MININENILNIINYANNINCKDCDLQDFCEKCFKECPMDWNKYVNEDLQGVDSEG